MTREPRSATAAQPERTSRLGRLRLRYHALPLSRRLVAALLVCFVASLLALIIGLSVLGTLTTVVVILVAFHALMRSMDAFVTVVVSVLWLTLSSLLFQIPLGGSPLVLLLLPVPILVVLVAGRVREYPVWHTTTLALTAGLLAGFSLALLWMIVRGLSGDADGPFPAWWPIALVYLAAAGCLLWRLTSARQIEREAGEAREKREAERPAPAAARTTGNDQRRQVHRREDASAAERQGKGPAAPASDDEPVPVDQALAELEDMIGLDPVKQQVRGLAASIEAARLRADAGFPVERPLRHLVFSGPPGTGKTSVARTLATVFHSFGLLPSAQVVEAQRADLVGEYLGATAIKTNELVDRALGGCSSSTRPTPWSTRATARRTGSATRPSRPCSSGPRTTATSSW